MPQAARRHINSGASYGSALDRNVIEMMILHVGCRFDLYEPPATISVALEHIDPHINIPVLECALEDRWNIRICNQLPSRPDRLLTISGFNGHAARKHLPRQKTDLSPLLNDRLRRIVRLRRRPRLVDDQVQALKTLRSGGELGLGDEYQS